MSHNINILHSELSYTWMALPLGRVTLFQNLVLNIKLILFYCNIEMYHIPANINLR